MKKHLHLIFHIKWYSRRYYIRQVIRVNWRDIMWFFFSVRLCALSIYMQISRKRFETETCYQLPTNRKWPMVDQMMTSSMTSRDRERSRSWSQHLLCRLFWKRLKIETRLQRGTYRKWHALYRMVMWSMTSRDPEGSKSWPSYIWQNGWLDPDAVWGGRCSRWRDGCIRWAWLSSKEKGQFWGWICGIPLEPVGTLRHSSSQMTLYRLYHAFGSVSDHMVLLL